EPCRRRGVAAAAQTYTRGRELQERLAMLRERAGARDRELDLLEWELAEIDRAEPSEAEEASLEAERGRLRHVEALRGAVAAGVGALDGAEEEGGAARVLAVAAQSLQAGGRG